MADTPENKRLAQQSKNQSEVIQSVCMSVSVCLSVSESVNQGYNFYCTCICLFLKVKVVACVVAVNVQLRQFQYARQGNRLGQTLEILLTPSTGAYRKVGL